MELKKKKKTVHLWKWQGEGYRFIWGQSYQPWNKTVSSLKRWWVWHLWWFKHCLEGYWQGHGDSSIRRVIRLEKPQMILKTEFCDFNPGFSRGWSLVTVFLQSFPVDSAVQSSLRTTVLTEKKYVLLTVAPAIHLKTIGNQFWTAREGHSVWETTEAGQSLVGFGLA